MSPIHLDEQLLTFYKRSLATILPTVQSSHRMQALAFGLGYLKYASLTAARNESRGGLVLPAFSIDAFASRIAELGYPYLVVPRDAVLNLLSYRTFVAQKNGFSFEAVRTMAAKSGYSENVSTIFAEMLCSQPLSDNKHNVLSGEQVRSILRVVPPFPAPPLHELGEMERETLAREPYRTNSGAALAMLSLNKWVVHLDLCPQRSFAAPVVWEVRTSRSAVEVSFFLAEHGRRLLQMAQEAFVAGAPRSESSADVPSALGGHDVQDTPIDDEEAPGPRV